MNKSINQSLNKIITIKDKETNKQTPVSSVNTNLILSKLNSQLKQTNKQRLKHNSEYHKNAIL